MEKKILIPVDTSRSSLHAVRYVVHISSVIKNLHCVSAFMNNVGALALFMPVAIHLARKYDRPPS
ncbi:MAG: hypothetical protein R6V15_07300, partial [Desulfotignum sp.]